MMGQRADENVKLQGNTGYGDKKNIAVVDWQLTAKIFEKVERENLLSKISETVLQTKSRISSSLLAKYVNNESRENYIKSVLVNLMSTPEYQLC